MQNRLPSPRVALLVAALAWIPCAGCTRTKASENAKGDAQAAGVRQREVPKVRVAPVEKREMLQELETTSVLESEREIVLFPRMSGIVTEVLAEEGQQVEEGAVLARLDDRDELLAVRDAEVALSERQNDAQVAALAVEEAKGLYESARLATAQRERDWSRNVKLYEESETKPLSRQEIEASRLELDRARGDEEQAEVTWRRRQLEVEAAQTAVDRARVTLERARLTLAHTQVLAPFAGVVAERTVRPGDMIGSTQPSFVLTDPEAIRAIFYRPQEELALFSRGASDGLERLSFRATTEALPGRTFSGEVERISPTISAESGQFRVTARLHPAADGEAPLLPGMLVRMHIVTDRHPDALVVPKRALRRQGERRYVLVAEPADAEEAAPTAAATAAGPATDAVQEPADRSAGQLGEHVLHEVVVREGFSDEDFVEVVPVEDAKLAVGTLVVVVGGRDLTEGDTVSVDAPATPGNGE